MKRNTTTNNKNGVFRPKRANFTQVSNTALRDPNLSLKAKGLYSLIQSYITIPDFTLYKWYLMSNCVEKNKAFDSAWKELKNGGYLKQYRIPAGENDTFIYEYELLDEPDLTTPALTNLNKNGEVIVKDETKEISSQNVENSHTPLLVPYADGIHTVSYPMPVVPDDNSYYMPTGGDINNINSNNTNPNNIESNHTDSSNTDINNIDLNNTNKKEDYTNSNNILSNHILSNHIEDTQHDIEDTQHDKDENRLDEINTKLDNLEKNIKKIKDQDTYNKTKCSWSTNKKNQYEYNTTLNLIQGNISYSVLATKYDIELLDEIVEIIVDTIISDFSEGHIIMGQQRVPQAVVKSTFLKLDEMDIQYFMECFKKQTKPTVKLNSYIRTALYNNKKTITHHYNNMVHTDLSQYKN